MRVVSDTSPVIGFAKLERLALLRQLFGQVLLPRRVYREFFENCTVTEEVHFQSMYQECFQVVDVGMLHTFSRRLDGGEKEALNLALQVQADIVLLDDRKAFNEAKDRQLVVASTRTILRFAEKQGLIASSQEMENALRKQQFFVPRY